LPRAITFTGSLYSIGVPPEILGLESLSDSEIENIKRYYENFEVDLKDSMQFANPNTPFFPKNVLKVLEKLGIDYEINEEHKELTKAIVSTVLDLKNYNIDELILRASQIRKFIG
jgi:phosphoenolpyruvate carboxylase